MPGQQTNNHDSQTKKRTYLFRLSSQTENANRRFQRNDIIFQIFEELGCPRTQQTWIFKIDDEFNAIETAVISKANTASPTFTGTVTMTTLDGATISGGTY